MSLYVECGSWLHCAGINNSNLHVTDGSVKNSSSIENAIEIYSGTMGFTPRWVSSIYKSKNDIKAPWIIDWKNVDSTDPDEIASFLSIISNYILKS